MSFWFYLLLVVFLAPLAGMAQEGQQPAPRRRPEGPPPRVFQERPGLRRGPGGPFPPGRRMGPMPSPALLERLRELPPEEQERVLRNNRRFQQLPQERQEELLERLHRFQELPPRQKELLERRFAVFRNLTPEQREKTREIYQQRWRGLPPERRQALIEEFRQLRLLSPEKREERLREPEMEKRFTSDERTLLQELSTL